jgi:hypothetical protein
MLSFTALFEPETPLLAERSQPNSIFVPQEFVIPEEPDGLGNIGFFGRDGTELSRLLRVHGDCSDRKTNQQVQGGE